MEKVEETAARKHEVRRLLTSLGAHVRRIGITRVGERWSIRAVIAGELPQHMKEKLAEQGIKIESD